jgi:glyoxylase-like metal-dependent hydrolase (beta-lactamase superfamily II)
MTVHKAMGRAWVGVVAALALASGAAAAPNDKVGFSIIRTGGRLTPESMLYQGGGKAKVDVVYSAILVRHGGQAFLFDTGLGSRIDAQYGRDMPRWKRPFFHYNKPVVPARDQLARAGLPVVRRIVLSHSHWDHASGVVDFPGAEVWVAPPERALVGKAGHGADNIWPSQVGDPGIAWTSIDFRSGPYRGFERSLDVYADGTVVLVPQYGHTAGSIGMFVTTSSGRRFFFCGDTVWSAAAIGAGRPKFWLARALVDADARATLSQVRRMEALRKRDPGLTIVPAHDGRVQARLGFFPGWVE